ncbi:MAG: PspC domain-containing protein, partial [Gaiellaceae bacterium]
MNETTVEQPAAKRLERSRSDRMLAGVSGGLARYFDIHPAFYRVGFVVLTLIGGAGVLIYVAAALVIPDEGEEDSIAAKALRERRDRPWPLVGLALIAIAALVLLSRVSIWPRGDASWILLLVGGIIVL